MSPLFFLFTLLVHLHFHVLNSQNPSSYDDDERAILLSMKQHWGDPTSLRWNSLSSPCNWPRVTCNSGSVAILDLRWAYISGTIPPAMCHQLKNLISIDLSNNNMSGHIPASFYNCSNLERLDLSMNSLSGKIPGELFLMRRLRYLKLDRNRLYGEISTLIESNSLVYLDLSNNQLNGSIPDDLGKLYNLTYLDLSENQLDTDITEILLTLRPMSVLWLCSNRFSGEISYEFVNQKFEKNCLDRSNLCSDYGNEGLAGCRYRLCSGNGVKTFPNCDLKKRFIIFIGAGVGCCVVGFAILYYVARKCWHKKHTMEWKMISFQKLKFNKTDILSNLTEENQIGEGGGGKVYRVFINQTGNSFAVKSISNARKLESKLEKEFLAEIHTVGAIWHANIVKLFCYISGKDLKLLVYQYFDNKSLDQWLHCKRSPVTPLLDNSSGRKLDWPKRLHIAIGVAQGLCYMHHDCNPPIIHRDIKPSNILLDSEFNAKIADFGLAKLLKRNGDTETASAVAGTFGYIAPEYAYTTKVNTKTDVYSFGVVLLELTTGRKAVTQGDPTNLAGWAQMHYRDSSAIFEALDGEMKDSTYLDQIITVFRLGVICTATSPSNRPSMKVCLHILQNCKNNMSSSSPMNLELAVVIH